MDNRTRVVTLVPVFCAIFIVGLTVLRPAHASDLTLGASTGFLIGLSILSLVSLKRKLSQPGRRD
jgi:hypothetical protein